MTCLRTRRCQYARIDVSAALGHSSAAARKAKLSQLQIRVSEAEKSAIRRAAKRAELGMSTYVLNRILSIPASRSRRRSGP